MEHHHSVSTTRQDVDFAVACGSVLARLVTPHASGEIHVRETEMASLLTMAPRTDLLRRLVVSQSMQPPVSVDECDFVSVAVDVENQTLSEAIHLIALACGFTPVSAGDSASLVISESDNSLIHENHECLGDFLTARDDDLLLKRPQRCTEVFLFHSRATAGVCT